MQEQKTLANEKDESIIPVFRFKILNQYNAICKYVGGAKKSDKIFDESLDFEKELLSQNPDSKDTQVSIDLGECGKYDLTVRACKCNVIGDYLIQHRKYPIYYTSLLYSSKFVGGYLMTMFLYFTLDEQTNKEIEGEPKKIVNRRLSGKFTVELVSDDIFLAYLIESKTTEIEQELMEKYTDTFESLNQDSEKEKLMDTISQEIQTRLDEYRKLFEPIEINYIPTQKRVLEYMVNFFRTHKLMKDLIKFGLKKKDIDRIAERCPDQSYEPPKRKYNIKELRDNPELIEKMIEDLSDQDSD